MHPGKVVWRKPFYKTFRHSLGCVADRLLCLVENVVGTRIDAWTTAGKHAWSLPVEGEHTDCFYPVGEGVFLGGLEAVRVDPRDGAVLCRRDFGLKVAVFPPFADCPVFLEGGPIDVSAFVGVNPDTLATEWRIDQDVDHLVVHGSSACAYVPAARELRTIGLPDLSRHSVRAPFDALSFSWHTHAAGLWCHFDDHVRYGIDARSGALVWRHVEREPGYHGYMTEVMGDRLYCGNRGISCYEGATGQLVWRQPLDGGPLCSQLRISGDVIWAGTQTGGVFRVRREDGALLGEHRPSAEPMVVEPIDDRRVAVASYRNLRCVEFD